MAKPSRLAVAALVYARENGGRVTLVGEHGKGAWEALGLGLLEDINGYHAELNLRGQDVADEAIARARKAA